MDSPTTQCFCSSAIYSDSLTIQTLKKAVLAIYKSIETWAKSENEAEFKMPAVLIWAAIQSFIEEPLVEYTVEVGQH